MMRWPSCPACRAVVPPGLEFRTAEGVVYCNAGCARDHAVDSVTSLTDRCPVENEMREHEALCEELYRTQFLLEPPTSVRKFVSRKHR